MPIYNYTKSYTLSLVTYDSLVFLSRAVFWQESGAMLPDTVVTINYSVIHGKIVSRVIQSVSAVIRCILSDQASFS